MSQSPLRTVSMQGTQLSSSQRRQLAFQHQIHQSFMSPVLSNQVKETLKAVEALKEEGAKPERIWLLERQETGTPCIAEWLGF